MKKPFPIPVRVQYSCAKCPAFCCTYSDIPTTTRDVERLARHFGVSEREARERFTKMESKGRFRVMRHKKDKHFVTACMMLDQETRRCTIYEARPAVCRKYPLGARCGYYEFLKFERKQQGDDSFVALT